MDSYYQNLVDQEIQRMRDRVTITMYEGHTVTTVNKDGRTESYSPESAIEATNREIAERYAISKQLEHCVAINPDTGHAYDLDFLAQFCKNIYEQPSSPRPLESALYVIGETIAPASYPPEDLQRIVDIFADLKQHAHLDIYLYNELGHILRRSAIAHERYATA